MPSQIAKALQRIQGLVWGDGVKDDAVYFDGHTLVVDVVGRDATAGLVVRALSVPQNVPTVIFQVNKDSGPVGPEARVYNSADQATTNGAQTVLSFDSERFDTDNIHSTTVNPSRLTCRTPGKYQIFATVAFESNSTGYRGLDLVLNAGTIIGRDYRTAVNGVSQYIAISTTYELVVGDYVEVWAEQNSGGSLNALALGNYSAEFGMVRVG